MAFLLPWVVVLGYCHECQRPSVVAMLELPGWRHKWAICGVCLRELAAKLDQASRGALG